jgi:hypothetical protein
VVAVNGAALALSAPLGRFALFWDLGLLLGFAIQGLVVVGTAAVWFALLGDRFRREYFLGVGVLGFLLSGLLIFVALAIGDTSDGQPRAGFSEILLRLGWREVGFLLVLFAMFVLVLMVLALAGRLAGLAIRRRRVIPLESGAERAQPVGPSHDGSPEP